MPARRAPGAGYEYSDLNYLLLGAVTQEADGTGFAEQMTRLGRDNDLKEMHSARVDTGLGDRYGQGWRVGELDGEPAVQHTGPRRATLPTSCSCPTATWPWWCWLTRTARPTPPLWLRSPATSPGST